MSNHGFVAIRDGICGFCGRESRSGCDCRRYEEWREAKQKVNKLQKEVEVFFHKICLERQAETLRKQLDQLERRIAQTQQQDLSP